MEPAFPKYQLSWLTDDVDSVSISEKTSDVEKMIIPIPKHLGAGTAYIEKLALGMTLMHATHKFSPKAFGTLIPVVNFDAQYSEESFCVQMAYGGEFCQFETYPKKIVLFRPKQSLFRYTSKAKVTSYVDCSSDSRMISFSIPRSSLDSFLGQEDSELVISRLNLHQPPAVEIHQTSLTLATKLEDATYSHHVGNVRKLHIQGKILDFFGTLLSELQSENQSFISNQSLSKRIRDFLLSVNGRIVTLDQLSAEFNLSAKFLNQTFEREYGESIPVFLSNYRLAQAKSAIEQTKTPLKTIASNLGYSHVNHFITAFKRKFGHTPGSIRKARYDENGI